MVDFRGNRKHRGKIPRNYLARREQLRLLLLVVSLGLVVMMMSIAAKPSTWAWLTGQDIDSSDLLPERMSSDEYDTRLRPSSDEQLPLDTFVAPAPQRLRAISAEDYFPGVKPEYFSDVQDNAPFRHAEHKAFFHLLQVLQKNEAKRLVDASTGRVGFVQLFEQPDVYRGKLVTLSGVIKRSLDYTPPKNEFGIDSYYQIWFRPDGGPNSPIVFYTLDLPDGFPTSRTGDDGEILDLHEKATITGFYYRNWAYLAGSQILTAPLVLAKTIRWHQTVEPVREPVDRIHIALAIASAALIGISIAAWVYWSSTQRAVPSLSELGKRYHVDSLRHLEDEDLGPDVSEALVELARQEERKSNGRTDV